MTDSLHDRLLAAVTARRELAEAAHRDWDYGDVYVGSTKARHKAANDPAQILRDTEAHMKTLERHRPGSQMPSGRRLCSCAHRYYTPYVEDCDALVDLAGIYPEVTE